MEGKAEPFPSAMLSAGLAPVGTPPDSGSVCKNRPLRVFHAGQDRPPHGAVPADHDATRGRRRHHRDHGLRLAPRAAGVDRRRPLPSRWTQGAFKRRSDSTVFTGVTLRPPRRRASERVESSAPHARARHPAPPRTPHDADLAPVDCRACAQLHCDATERLWPVGWRGTAQGCASGRIAAIAPCGGLRSIARSLGWAGRLKPRGPRKVRAAPAPRPTPCPHTPQRAHSARFARPHGSRAHPESRRQPSPARPPSPTGVRHNSGEGGRRRRGAAWRARRRQVVEWCGLDPRAPSRAAGGARVVLESRTWPAGGGRRYAYATLYTLFSFSAHVRVPLRRLRSRVIK